MTQYISLLRGINVGGHRQIKMAALKSLFESVGFDSVITLLQTGNVLFTSPETELGQLATRIEEACEKEFGFHTDILLLTAETLQEIVNQSPFSNPEARDPRFMHVTFLSGRPERHATEALLSYKGPEELFVTDHAVYIYYPEGAGRSKLTNSLVEKRLNVRATARNWNTVTKLLALVS